MLTFMIDAMNQLQNKRITASITLNRGRINSTFDLCWDAPESIMINE